MILELAKYITQWSRVEHKWGETDCMMFAICWHDVRFGTNKNLSLYKKYNTQSEALRFYKNFIKVEGWLVNNSYKQLTAKKPKFKDGDVIVKNYKLLDLCWVYFNNSFYTMDEERGLIRIAPSVVQYDTVWRR
jgi:hypothetical protein